jgi:uncharacterized protein (TIGR02246 family)
MTQTAQPDLERRLADLEAKEEIRAFVADYCRLNDALTELDALVALFAEDAVMRNPAGTHDGREAIRTYYTNFFKSGTAFARHHVVNQVIRMDGPDRARHDAYFIAMLGRDGESKIVYGSYADTLVKRDGGWLFQEKINDIVAPTTLEAGWAEGFGTHSPIGRTI